MLSLHNTTIGTNANFHTVAGDSTITYNSYHNSGTADVITVNGRTVRRVIDGDIIFRRHISTRVLSVNVNSQKGVSASLGSRVVKVKQNSNLRRRLWSRVLSVIIKPQGGSSTPRTSTGSSQVVKVRKTQQTAEIYGYSGVFTVTTLEPVDENNREIFEEFAKKYLEAVMRWRSALLIQVFAVAESSALTLIVHDELASGDEFSERHREKDMTVFYYLNYTQTLGIQSLRDNETLTFPVTDRWEDWFFNVKTLSWHYNLASISLNPPSEEDLEPYLFLLSPLRQGAPPRLNTAEINTFFEETLGDGLYLIASFRQGCIIDLSCYARHGLLTFGTVIDKNKPKILAHHSSTPSPEWFCCSRNPDVKASYSSSGRVDLAFCKIHDVEVGLQFSLCLPDNNCDQFRCAYLSQSFCLHDSANVEDVVYINQVGFYLKGTFVNDPTTCNLPAYLFVPPLHIEVINNLYCVYHPFPQQLFYWARDQQGRNIIAEKDWEKFGIPELRVEEWIGSSWNKACYTTVQESLRSRNFDLDGRQYAHEHGYPELIFADPHETVRIEELEGLDADLETPSLHPQLASPLPPSHVKTPAKDPLTLMN